MSAATMAPSPVPTLGADGQLPPQQQAPLQQQQPQQQQPQQQPQTQTQAQPSTPGHPTYVSPSLYIGDLHPDVTEAMLFEVFNSVGPVTSIRVCRDSVTRRSLGYAYVNYQTLQDAERSLDALNYTLIRGQPCRIMWSQRDPTLRKSGNGNVFVKNLDRSIDNKALYDTFSLFGNILSCKVGVDESNRSKGYGFVHYESEASAKSAIEKVNGMLIGGKTVYVGPFVTRSERESAGEQRYTNLYLKNLPKAWATEEALRAVLEPYGTITSLVVRQDPKGRTFAFCNFAEHADARQAVEALNGRIVTPKGFKEGTTSTEPQQQQQQQQQQEQGQEGAANGGAAPAAPSGEALTESPGATTEASSSSSSSGSGGGGDNTEEQVLFVGPHQSRAQRSAALRARFEQLQQEKGERYQGVNLYVKNLDDSVDDERLRELFEPFGPTSSVKVMRDDRGVSRGFGFVCFLNAEDATKAVAEMHLKYVRGKPLYTGLAERREQRLQRLQQRFRLPQMRGPPAPGVAGAPHVGYPGAPAAALAGVGGFQARPVLYPPQAHMPMIHWTGGRQQQQQQQLPQGVALQRGMAPALQHIYGQQSAVAAAAALQASLQQQQQPMVPQQRGPGHRGVRGGGAAGNGKQQQQLLQKQQQLPGGGSFKFTPQVRNPRVEQQQQQQLHLQQQQQVPVDAPHLLLAPDAPLTAAALAAAQPSMQKQMLGERLFPLIARHQPELAGKITGMMLEMDNSELLILLESEPQLKSKIDEALGVLRSAN